MREEGFYWVKYTSSSEWEIALFQDGHWCFAGTDNVLGEVYEVDERRLTYG